MNQRPWHDLRRKAHGCWPVATGRAGCPFHAVCRAESGSSSPDLDEGIYSAYIPLGARHDLCPHLSIRQQPGGTRLPKEFRFEVDQVEIYRRGDEVILRPVPANAAAIFDVLTQLPDDFMPDDRYDAPPQERKLQ